MSEIVNSVSAPKIQSRRCLACRLPAELRENIERDRIRHWKTFDSLAQELASKGFSLSPASLRRHFAHHVDLTSQFDAGQTDDRSQENVNTPFDALVGTAVDDRAVAEAMVRVLVEQLQSLEKARRATRDRVQAERLTARCLKEMAALDRALRRWEEIKKPREELRAKLKETLDRIPDAVGEAYQIFMQEHLEQIDSAVEEHLHDYSYPDRLVRRLKEAKAELRKNFGPRMVMAVKNVTQETLDALR